MGQDLARVRSGSPVLIFGHRLGIMKPNLIFLFLALIAIQIVIVENSHSQLSSDPDTPKGTIKGQVVDAKTKEPLTGVGIFIIGENIGARTDSNGDFLISELAGRAYTLRFSRSGYETKSIESVTIGEDGMANLHVELMEEVILLKDLVVTPGRFGIMGAETPAVRQTLSRKDIKTLPQFGEDLYRAVNRLPGVSPSNDYSAKFVVRGGEHDEVLVLMDGLEIYEPFHMRDVNGGALSIIDVDAVEGIDLMTGGFSAEYGDRLSGVFNIKSRKAPEDQRIFTAGISMLNARASSQGTFSNNKGSWLVSARRGYMDLALKMMGEDEDFKPTYYDVLGKAGYRLSENHTLSVNFLHAGDDTDLAEGDGDVSHTEYGNTYGWLTLKSILSPGLFAETVASIGQVTHKREGTAFYGGSQDLDFTVTDSRDFDLYGLKQSWSFELSQRHYLKWGFDVKKLTADYDYSSEDWEYYRDAEGNSHPEIDITQIKMNPSGHKLGAYLANRFRIFSPLTTEIGLRYDYASYTGDKLLSPRLNLVYALGKQTFIRCGWGHFYQTQGIHEIDVQDGEKELYGAELAEHRVIGFEHYFSRGIHLRLEGYQKELSDLRPEYRNWRGGIEFFPELVHDRVKVMLDGSTAKGIEIYLKNDSGGKFTWWASYALAEATDNLRSYARKDVEIQFNDELPGVYDQRHAFYFDINYRPNPVSHLNLAWQCRTGLPYTNVVLKETILADGTTGYYAEADEPHGERYPAFHRLDLRVSRDFNTSKGRITAFLEIMNLYNRGNVRMYSYILRCDEPGDCRLEKRAEHSFGLLPSIGITWSW